MQLILYPYALRQIQSKYSDTIYRFEDLKTRKRMEKTTAQNINFEESYDRLKFLPETRGSKMVFELQLPNQSPERNGSSDKNGSFGNLYRSHIVRLHLEGTIFFGPTPLPDLLRGRLISPQARFTPNFIQIGEPRGHGQLERYVAGLIIQLRAQKKTRPPPTLPVKSFRTLFRS